jgi:hypothetical protein
VRIHLYAYIRTIVVLTYGKLTWIYFPHLLFVTMHRRQGKKVSILLPGDVNPWPVPSRRGLLDDSPYHVVGAAVHCAMSHDHKPRAYGDLGMSCGDLRKAWIRSCNVCSAIHAILNAWAPLGGISGDVWHICILYFFAGTLTTIAKIDALELTTGISVTATDYSYVLYNGQVFFW